MALPFTWPGMGFPPAHYANEDGLIAVGGDLTVRRLLEAYSKGIFPWPHEHYPLLWFCPDPRWIIPVGSEHIPRSVRKVARKETYTVRADTNFERVIEMCASVPRPGQQGTWISAAMIEAYTELHQAGYAHSIEAYENDTLVGGLYGVSLGGMFFGESMAATRADASKVAFYRLLQSLRTWEFDLVDCQTETEHLKRFGAQPLSRSAFVQRLEASLRKPTRRGPWQLVF